MLIAIVIITSTARVISFAIPKIAIRILLDFYPVQSVVPVYVVNLQHFVTGKIASGVLSPLMALTKRNVLHVRKCNRGPLLMVFAPAVQVIPTAALAVLVMRSLSLVWNPFPIHHTLAAPVVAAIPIIPAPVSAALVPGTRTAVTSPQTATTSVS